MKQNSITQLNKLNSENYENIFNVYLDESNFYFYNILNKVNFPQNLPNNYFTSYVIQQGDTLPFISYKTLLSPNNWWLITLANNIDDPTQTLIPGTVLKIPIPSVARDIIAEINSQ